MEIGPCCNEQNNDHLATVKQSSKGREKNNLQLIVCGFNGFGQFKCENKRKLLQFEELKLDLINDHVLVVCTWNCLAVANGYSLYLQGFISSYPQAVRSLKTEVPIKCLDICDKFCLILKENGKVYKLTLASGDELREVKFQTDHRSIISPKRNTYGNKIATDLQIAHIACGNNITIAVSTTNSVFSGTIQIYEFPKHQRIKQLKCGFEHVLLLTSNGDIYAWGNGLRGQLGLAVLRVQETPTLIEALAGIKITYIAAGGWHCAAISSFGDIYTWGFNSNGQLGLRLYKTGTEHLKEPSVYPLPQLVAVPTCQYCNNTNDTLDSCFPIKVAAGGRHTILQMKCGSIYACGWNAYGQLGVEKSKQYYDKFEFVYKIDGHDVNSKQIICGDWCTLIQK